MPRRQVHASNPDTNHSPNPNPNLSPNPNPNEALRLKLVSERDSVAAKERERMELAAKVRVAADEKGELEAD